MEVASSDSITLEMGTFSQSSSPGVEDKSSISIGTIGATIRQQQNKSPESCEYLSLDDAAADSEFDDEDFHSIKDVKATTTSQNVYSNDDDKESTEIRSSSPISAAAAATETESGLRNSYRYKDSSARRRNTADSINSSNGRDRFLSEESDDLVPPPSSSLRASTFSGSNTSGDITSMFDKYFRDECNEYVEVQSKRSLFKSAGTKSSSGPGVFVNHLRLAQEVRAHVGAIYHMAFSPDGHFLATGGEDGQLIIWTVGQTQFQPMVDDSSSTYSRPTSSSLETPRTKREIYNHSASSISSSDEFHSDGISEVASEGTGSARNISQLASSSQSTMGVENTDSGKQSNSNRSPELLQSNKSGIGRDAASGASTGAATGNGTSSASASAIDKSTIIYPVPCRIFKGHSEPILNISWSKSNFVLTASSDQSVCLWHVLQNEVLKTFTHNDIVTCVDFHPVHDRYFLSGSFDGKIRLWDIITQSVADFVLTRSGGSRDSGKVTCVKFSPDGARVVAGFFGGMVVVYQCIARQENKYELKYSTQFPCKDSRGRYRDGAKVTGLSFVETTKSLLDMGLPHTPNQYDLKLSDASLRGHVNQSRNQDYMLLVTTNDNNVRLIDWAEKTTYCKYKGGENESLQIQAHCSSDYRFLISGTEAGYAVVWSLDEYDTQWASQCWASLGCKSRQNSHKRNNSCVTWKVSESLPNSIVNAPVTSAIFAPAASIPVFLSSFEDACYMNTTNDSSAPKKDEMESNGNGNGGNSRPSSGDNNQFEYEAPLYSFNDEVHFSSLLIATSDFDGTLRMYVRQLPSKEGPAPKEH